MYATGLRGVCILLTTVSVLCLTSNLVFSLDIPPSVNQDNDWLLQSLLDSSGCPSSQVSLDSTTRILSLTNTLILRSFLTSPCFTTVEYQRSASFSLASNYSFLRTIGIEGNISFNGNPFDIGGCAGYPSGHAEFFNEDQFLSTLSASNRAFSFQSYSVSPPIAPFPWTPRRGAPAAIQWPPKGLHLAIQLNPPNTTDWQPFSGMSVVVHYEIYDCLPIIRKWISVSNQRAASLATVEVSSLMIEMLRAPNGAPDRLSILVDIPFNPTPWDAEVVPQANGPQVGNTGQIWFTDPDYDACCDQQLHAAYSVYTYLKAGYSDNDTAYNGPLGPGALLKGGDEWESISIRILLHDSNELERKGLEIRRVESFLAPQLMENPLAMMITDVSTSSAFEYVIDQAAKAGLEMLVVGYGADGYCGLCDGQMLNETWRDWFASELKYAHAHGLEVTAYTLMQHNGWGEDTPDSEQVLAANGQRAGIACFATDWHAMYRKNVLDFIKNVSLDGLETDGQYEYAACYDTTGDHDHNGVRGGWDAQLRATTSFNSQLKVTGAYQSGADAYMFSGANRWNHADSDAGYNLPDFWEYMSAGRLYSYDSTYTRLPGSGMYGMGDLSSNALQKCGASQRLMCIDFAIASFIASGTIPYVRAQWLAAQDDVDRDAIIGIFQNWHAFWKQYRLTLIGDFLHIVEPTNRKIESTMHVDSYSCAKEGVCGIVTLVNPTAEDRNSGKLAVSMYLAGMRPGMQVWTQQVQDKFKWKAEHTSILRSTTGSMHTVGKDGLGIYEIALEDTVVAAHSYTVFLVTSYSP